jgi:hypothetical protein
MEAWYWLQVYKRILLKDAGKIPIIQTVSNKKRSRSIMHV